MWVCREVNLYVCSAICALLSVTREVRLVRQEARIAPVFRDETPAKGTCSSTRSPSPKKRFIGAVLKRRVESQTMAAPASTLSPSLVRADRNRSEARGNAAGTGLRTGKTVLGLACLCADELALYDERRVCRNEGIQPLGAVAQIGRKNQTRLVAHVHLEQTQVKPSDHRASAEAEAQRLTAQLRVAVARVHDLHATHRRNRVVHRHIVALAGRVAAALVQLLDGNAAMRSRWSACALFS